MYGTASITVTGAALKVARMFELRNVAAVSHNKLYRLLSTLTTRSVYEGWVGKSVAPAESAKNIDQLRYTVSQYIELEHEVVWTTLRKHLYLVEFAFRINRERKSTAKTPHEIFKLIHKLVPAPLQEQEGSFCERLRKMLHEGSRMLAVITGGSFYYFLAIISSEIVNELKYVKGPEAWRIAALLRKPDNGTPTGRIITQDIVPAISTLASRFPIRLGHLLSQPLLEDFAAAKGLSASEYSQILIGDISRCDRIVDDEFQAFQIQTPRSSGWEKIQNAPKLPFDTSPFSTMSTQDKLLVFGNVPKGDASPVEDINTQFKIVPGKLPRMSQENKLAFAERSREHVMQNLLRPIDFQQLREVVLSNLQEGTFLKKTSKYVLVDSSLFEGKVLRIMGKRKGETVPIVVICANAPPDLFSNAISQYVSIMPGLIGNYDSNAVGQDLPFTAWHFSIYNKYSAVAQDEDVDRHPSTFFNGSQGAQGNTSTRLPRPSKDCLKHPLQHHQLNEIFQVPFEWTSSQFMHYFPKESGDLIDYLSTVPGQPVVSVFPLPCVAINHNGLCLPHKDSGDSGTAGVVAFLEETPGVLNNPERSRGELVIDAAGLVLRLGDGYPVFFPACELVHYNLHYSGRRLSFVFHSDSSAKVWTKDYNGLKNNHYLRVPQ
ncbi:hypothetical protein FA15DRAFT_711544 [Coprinopsis marcescibilis]|uniref:Uncharacterized protein n=1 Tax=Coprinopsis marcescibilis TaxID=230819 RepID=A0A5C3K9P8_COPMA|nr:hypothetical protein FA15DRAFT_711544 [Coprinopsis marcescibilis]